MEQDKKLELLGKLRLLVQQNTKYKISEIKRLEIEGTLKFRYYFFISIPGFFGKKITKVEFFDSVFPEKQTDLKLEIINNSNFKPQTEEIKKLLLSVHEMDVKFTSKIV